MGDKEEFTVVGVVSTTVQPGAQAIELLLHCSDGTERNLICDMRHAPSLAMALRDAASMAQRINAGQNVSVVVPYWASSVMGGRFSDGRNVALIFSTAEGFPLQVAMPDALAVETIKSLQEVLIVSAKEPSKLS